MCGGQTECHLMNVEPVESIIETGDLTRHRDPTGARLLEVDGACHLGGALQHADCLDHRDKLRVLSGNVGLINSCVQHSQSQQEAAILYTNNL